jgi:PAS domain S-box-containing protein
MAAQFEPQQSLDRAALLRLAVDAAGLAIWDTDLTTGQSFWSENHFRLFGYPVDPEGRATRDMWLSRLHPEDRDMAVAGIRRARQDHIPYRSEYRVIRADNGEILWVESRGRFFYDSSGRAIRLMGTVREFTARRQAEEQLAQRETQLDIATRIVGIGIFDHDHLSGRMYWSELQREIHEMAPDVTPTIGAYQTQLHPEDREALETAVRAAHDPTGNGVFNAEYRIIRRNGETRWIVGRAQTFFAGEGARRRAVRTVGAEYDVTAHKRIEMDLRAERHSLAVALEAAAAGAFDWTIATGETYWSDGSFRILGLNRGAAPVNYGLWRQRVHSDDIERVERAIQEALTKHQYYRTEYRILRANDGQERWIVAQGLPITENGRAVRMVGVITDITDRRLAETRLRASEAALREADQRKDEFLATLAHELRNPLAPIRNAAQMLTLPNMNEEQLSWAGRVIHRQVEHMARLLDDLLDVARITRGKLQLKKGHVDFGSIVDTAVEAARPLITEKKHGLTLELPPELPTLEADPVRLAQVLSNLLTNAAKYTDVSGHIALTARVEGDMLCIAVRDNGIGLSPSARKHIFEMFSQVHDDQGRSEGGLGIGLALVKGLIDLHGGTIEALSAGPGCGSEFVVRIPIGPSALPKADAPTPTEATRNSIGCRILVADDNQDAADSLALLLESRGHEVRTAHGGHAALVVASAFRPEIALLDIGMPDLNGYEVARQLRQCSWGKSVRLIALTGWGQEEDRRRAIAAGFDRHLTKPVDLQALESLIASLAGLDRDGGDL